MNQSRLEWKVGVFVLIGLTLLGVLLLQFSKGASLFRPSYHILLRSENVSGLKGGADVLMSGVKVGTVTDVLLAPDGKSVLIELTIYTRYQIHKDARFAIEQAGFLGDQYVSITPTDNSGAVFQNGDEAKAEAPFNLQAAARSASDLVASVESTTKILNQSLNDLREYLLNPRTLTNLAVLVANMRTVSERAIGTVDSLEGLLLTNGPAVSQSTSNLSQFSVKMNLLASSLNELLATNAGPINSAVSNIDASSASLRLLISDVEEGKGLAGKMVRDRELSDSVSQITRNLSITSSNLNRLGLWGILWKHKEPKPPGAPVEKLSAPKETHR